MTALILLAVALAVFVMGYRFFGKFLALGVLTTQHDAPVPAVHRGDDRDHMACHWLLLMPQHLAATVGILSLPGVAVALVWGWVPAFLWIVAGSLVAGGVYVFGALWASLRQSGDSLAGVAFDLTGMQGALALFGLGVLVAVLTCAFVAALLGQLLHAHPEATWGFLSLVAATPCVHRALGGDWSRKLPWLAAAAILVGVGLWLGQAFPLALSGTWNLSIGGSDLLSLSHEMIWAMLALTFAYLAIKRPVADRNRPRGVMLGVLLGLLILLVLSGLVISLPEVTAPHLQTELDLPSPLMLLFFTVTGGALAGVHGLIATGPTLRQLGRQRDAARIAYGTALGEGLVALIVLLVIIAGVGSNEEWQALYGMWPEQPHMYVWLDLAVTKLARFVAAVGIAMPLAVGLVATVFAGLALVMLEQVLRALGFAVHEFVEDFELEILSTPHFRERAAAGTVAVATLCLMQTDVGLDQWLALGLVNQLFVCCVFLVLVLAMTRIGRPAMFFAAPLVILLLVSAWASAWLFAEWWSDGLWGLSAIAVLALVLCAWSLTVGGLAYAGLRRQRQTALGASSPP